ncbi:aromatic-ring-hydroxylating dioxygenase subunit beta, partial [Pseudomonas aeruginosa]
LLDDRLLDTWFALFERAARYRVLPLQEQLAGQAPEDSLYIIDDDHVRLRERVDSILGGHTWMEQPRSRTRRLVGNVRLKRVEGELVSSRSNFVVHQFRNREAWNFVGEA